MLSRFRRFNWGCWLILGMLTTLISIQLSPYIALAVEPSHGTSSSPRLSSAADPGDLLAQLQSLPNGTVSLPNFDPGVNGFQFSNQELIQSIDLVRNAKDWEEVLTDQLQQLFGTQVCIGQEVRTCVLTAAAQDWLKTQLGRMNQGLSEGMSAAVLALWQPQPPAQIPWWQRLVNFLLQRTVFGLARTLFDLQTFIANLFLMQGVTEVAQQTQAIRESLTPTRILFSILDVFLTGSLDPFTMGIYRTIEGALTEGHSLTPYRAEDRGNGKYWVYVYDSNYPAGRATSPTDLHVEFDTVADTWAYQPTATAPMFKGDAQSKPLDLTQLSWRQAAPADQPLAAKGPFTCPFCAAATVAEAPVEPTTDITLIGEGTLAVALFSSSPPLGDQDQVALVPFKGGLNREVPASYRLPADRLGTPLAITLTGAPTTQRQTSTLQLTGPGYNANFEGLTLQPNQTLTLYVVPTPTGPELTFVANRAAEIPKLSISLTDAADQAYTFNSSTPTEFSLTERRVSRSSGFAISGLKLPQGKRVALSAQGDRKRLYFADDAQTNSQYTLTVTNRMVIKDRIQLGERQPDFVNYTLTYDEEMRASNIQVEAQTQAFFDYDPAFIDPAEQSRDELLAAFDQRNFPITIAYEPLAARPGDPGPMQLTPNPTGPTGQRVFQASLQKAIDK